MAKQTDVIQAGTDLELYDRDLFPELGYQDPVEAQARFARRFLAAKDVDDLFDVLEGNSSKHMVGRKVQVNAVQWLLYESERGPIPNAICEAIDLDTGEVIEFATTSGMLTMFIRKAELLGQLGFQARIASKTTRSGQKALNFERM